MQLRTKTELHYYLRRIQELEEYADCTFEHVSDLRAYVEGKLAKLERNLATTENNACEVWQEIVYCMNLKFFGRKIIYSIDFLLYFEE